jgi:hypothetical protein
MKRSERPLGAVAALGGRCCARRLRQGAGCGPRAAAHHCTPPPADHSSPGPQAKFFEVYIDKYARPGAGIGFPGERGAPAAPGALQPVCWRRGCHATQGSAGALACAEPHTYNTAPQVRSSWCAPAALPGSRRRSPRARTGSRWAPPGPLEFGPWALWALPAGCQHPCQPMTAPTTLMATAPAARAAGGRQPGGLGLRRGGGL